MAERLLVLLASGDPSLIAAIGDALGPDRESLVVASSPEGALAEAKERDPPVVVADLRWPAPRPSGVNLSESARDWLAAISSAAPRAKLILLAKPDGEKAAWELVRRGAVDCLVIPPPQERLAASLHNALARSALEREGSAWREIQALLEVSHAVTSDEDLSRILQKVMDSAMAVTGADSGSLLLFGDQGEATGDVLHIAAARGIPTEVVAGTRLKPGEGIAGWVAQHGEPVLLRGGPEGDPRFRHLETRQRIGSSVCVPVRARPGRLIGVVCLNTEKGRRRFTRRDLDLMTIYAGSVGTLIEAARAIEGHRSAGKRLERSLKRLRAAEGQLVQSSKMAALGLLASGIAHEFNNLLTGIYGMAQLAEETGKREHVEKSLRVAVENSRRARDIVKNLLSFARPYSKPGEAVDLASATDEVLELIRREVDSRGVKLVKNYRPAPPVAIARGEVQQVILNLVLNAVQAMEGREGGLLAVGLRRRSETVVLTVADTGVGIPRAALPRLFEPFFSTKSLLGGSSEPRGAGLGLSVSFGIVRAAGGRIRVKSREGAGTVFTVRLPLAPPTPGPFKRPITERRVAPPVPAGARVLVVDDEWWVREFLRECLAHAGYAVAIAGTGDEAREAMRDLPPDAALVDIVLANGESGTTLADEIRKSHPNARILYMTGKLTGSESERRLREEADGFLAKPFSTAEVLGLLAAALGESEEEQAPPPGARGHA
ncbi:MAG: response regulator [Planctomycetales bacterium]|nr:response regulator [Planctomycetales bacterium]